MNRQLIGKAIYLAVFVTTISYGVYFLSLDKSDLERQSNQYNRQVKTLNVRFFGTAEDGVSVSVLPLTKGHTSGPEETHRIAFKLENYSDAQIEIEASISNWSKERYDNIEFPGTPTKRTTIKPHAGNILEWEYILKDVEDAVADTISIGVRASRPERLAGSASGTSSKGKTE